MQSIYKQLRRVFLGLFMLGLLAACQSTPEKNRCSMPSKWPP